MTGRGGEGGRVAGRGEARRRSVGGSEAEGGVLGRGEAKRGCVGGSEAGGGGERCEARTSP